MATVSLETVKQYAPAAMFHQNESTLPCSIEHLLQGSSLNRRVQWREAEQIPKQSTQTPAAASFKGRIYIVYPAFKGAQLWVSSSADGSKWDQPLAIAGQAVHSPSSFISMTVFQDKLWIAYTGQDGPSIYVSWSADGKSWEYKRVEGQSTWAPVMTAYNGGLYMVYRSDKDSTTWQSESRNGLDWVNTRPIPGREFVNACLVFFKEKLHLVYAGGRAGSDLYSLQYDPSSGTWESAKIEGQAAYNVALAPCRDSLVMVYSGNNSSQFYCSQTPDGKSWQDTQPIPGQNGSVPAFLTHGDRAYMICAREGAKGQLYITSISSESGLTKFSPIINPRQEDLLKHSSEDFYISIAESQWGGQPIPQAPMYYAVQEDDERVRIHYIFLYAKQGKKFIFEQPLSNEELTLIPNSF
jgi:hypothetical protein